MLIAKETRHVADQDLPINRSPTPAPIVQAAYAGANEHDRYMRYGNLPEVESKGPDWWERWLALAFWAVRETLGLILMAALTAYAVVELANRRPPLTPLLRYLIPGQFPPS